MWVSVRPDSVPSTTVHHSSGLKGPLFCATQGRPPGLMRVRGAGASKQAHPGRGTRSGQGWLSSATAHLPPLQAGEQHLSGGIKALRHRHARRIQRQRRPAPAASLFSSGLQAPWRRPPWHQGRLTIRDALGLLRLPGPKAADTEPMAAQQPTEPQALIWRIGSGGGNDRRCGAWFQIGALLTSAAQARNSSGS